MNPVVKRAGRAVKGVLARRLPPVAYARIATAVYQRRVLRLAHPRRYSDLVQRRMLYDRSPDLAWTCDKEAMKEHARASGAAVRVPETLWFGTDLARLVDAGLDGRWVLKRNGSSQLVYFGQGPVTPESLAGIEARFARHRDPFQAGGEWAYSQARPGYLAERLIGDPPLPDYKVFVFHGHAVVVNVYHGRGTSAPTRAATYSRQWEPLRAASRNADASYEPAPAQLDALLAAAERIAAGFDFLRVDFYLHEGALWFGETTPYPGAGRSRIAPAFDRWLGDLWLSGSHDAVVARYPQISRFLA